MVYDVLDLVWFSASWKLSVLLRAEIKNIHILVIMDHQNFCGVHTTKYNTDKQLLNTIMNGL